jgi:hypothetical protein
MRSGWTHFLLVAALAVFLTGCSRTTTVKADYQFKTAGNSVLASVPGTKIRLGVFTDSRPGRAGDLWIGNRGTAFEATVEEVKADRPVAEIIRLAVQAELTRAGHIMIMVGAGEDAAIDGQVVEYLVGTDASPSEWDVVGQVTFYLEAKKAGSDSSVTLGPYTAKKSERIYTMWPSSKHIKKALDGALKDAMREMSSDPGLAQALAK